MTGISSQRLETRFKGVLAEVDTYEYFPAPTSMYVYLLLVFFCTLLMREPLYACILFGKTKLR